MNGNVGGFKTTCKNEEALLPDMTLGNPPLLIPQSRSFCR